MSGFYGGIDLHAKSNQACIIDDKGVAVKERKIDNDLDQIISFFETCGSNIEIALESTINWYWLVDGLTGAGFDVSLAHPYGLRLIFKLLTDIPGIARVYGLTIYYEVGDISRFESARHFSSYCRLVPGVHQSSEKIKRGPGSKQGNPYLEERFFPSRDVRRQVRQRHRRASGSAGEQDSGAEQKHQSQRYSGPQAGDGRVSYPKRRRAFRKELLFS